MPGGDHDWQANEQARVQQVEAQDGLVKIRFFQAAANDGLRRKFLLNAGQIKKRDEDIFLIYFCVYFDHMSSCTVVTSFQKREKNQNLNGTERPTTTTKKDFEGRKRKKNYSELHKFLNIFQTRTKIRY